VRHSAAGAGERSNHDHTGDDGVTLGVRLTVVGDGFEADAICGLLRTEGIACNHRQTDMGAGAWEATGTGGPREILVAASDLERAKELIRPESA
jgi:Putative prokaryotic signal transducing protein